MLHARYHQNLQKIREQNMQELQEQHAERWQKIMTRKLEERPELQTLDIDIHDQKWQDVFAEVDIALALELRSSTT
jgi:hypothetical protein